MNEVDIARNKDAIPGRKPKILFWDVETSPLLGWAWGAYETDILKIEQDVKIISVAWRWEHENKTHVLALPDFDGYRPNPFKINDGKLIQKIWELVGEADVIVAQNGDKFDMRIANARMFALGIKPPKTPIQVDTLKIARRYFNLSVYKLDDILRYVGLPGKVSTGGKELWFKCMSGDMEAWKKMKQYNKNDVDILPALYDKMKGWNKSGPILTNFTREHMTCPTCLKPTLIKRGLTPLRTGWKQEYSCSNCGKWCKGSLIRADDKIQIV